MNVLSGIGALSGWSVQAQRSVTITLGRTGPLSGPRGHIHAIGSMPTATVITSNTVTPTSLHGSGQLRYFKVKSCDNAITPIVARRLP